MECTGYSEFRKEKWGASGFNVGALENDSANPSGYGQGNWERRSARGFIHNLLLLPLRIGNIQAIELVWPLFDRLVFHEMDTFRSSVNDLAKACAYSASAAEWEQFVHLAMPLVAQVAMRVCRLWMSASTPAMVDDIVQEVFLKLCEQERRILRNFEPRGEDSFFGLLRIVSASVANDYFRRLCSAKRGGRTVTSSFDEEAATTPESAASQSGQMQQAILLAQLDLLMRSAPEVVGDRDRSIFWLYYLQGFTAEEIAGISGTSLSPKGVESALRRVAMWLRGELNERKPENSARIPRQETTS